MAVENKYTDANVVAGKKAEQFKIGSGGDTFTIVGLASVASADDDGSVYRIFANVPSNAVPINIAIHNTAITSGTDYDIGLYKARSGAVIDKDILADGLDMSSARTIATWNNAGLTTLTLGEFKTLATLSAQTNPDEGYDIAITANTVGSAAGSIVAVATFVYA